MNKKKAYYAERKRKKKVEELTVIKQLITSNEDNFYYKMTDYFDCTGFQGIARTTLACAKEKTKQEIESKFINLYPFLKGRELK